MIVPSASAGGRLIEFRVLGTLDLRGLLPAAADVLLGQPRPAALLTYLAVARPGHFHRRDHLAALFWPETDQGRARTNLRKLLFALRRTIGPEAIIARGDEDLRLDPAVVWCDAAEFTDAVNGARFPRAVELYRGALLPGFHLPESRGFQDWLDTTRHALARDAITAALVMAEAHATNQERTDVGDLVQFILRLGAVIDDEHQLRKLLQLLDRIGDRPGALRLYEMFRKRLWDDYRAVPANETRTLVERYRGQ